MNNKNKAYQKWPIGLLLITIMAMFNHCLVQSPQKNKRNAKKNQENTEQVENDLTATQNSNFNNTTLSPSPSSVGTNGQNPATGNDYFENQVVPILKQSCVACHTEPFNNPAIAAPLSLYVYSAMKAKLINGQSDISNELINKVKGIIGHTGGNRCPSGNTDTICQLLQNWYNIEIPPVPPVPIVPIVPTGTGAPGPAPSVNLSFGAISSLSSMGRVIGWAADSNDPSKTLTVNFYVNGPMGTGDPLGSVSANLSGFNGGVNGQHAFIFNIPIIFRDGNSHLLYASIEDNSNEIQLTSSPWTFTAYTSTAAGFNYYTFTVKPLLLNRCSSCHAITYDSHYTSLISPSPAQGGTQNNNQMINMPSGFHNGINHPGGQICATKDSSPCQEIQQWWLQEF